MNMPSIEESMLFGFWIPKRVRPMSETRDWTSGSMERRVEYWWQRAWYLAWLVEEWLSGDSRV